MRDFKIAQFTSSSTAAIVNISLGFTPDFCIVINDAQGTNPNFRYWLNRAHFSQWQAGADDSILDTGSTGVKTLDTASIAAYAGGDTVTSTDVTNRKYAKADGSLYAAGDVTSAGITIPAGDQVNDGKNFVLAFRDSTKS